MFYFENFTKENNPDIICLSKTFGGGKSSISCLVIDDDVYNKSYSKLSDTFLHTTTYNGFAEESVTAIEALNIIAQDNILDLDDTIRQYLEINTPMSPVCTDNCLGLCFLCGGNLNITRCICEGLNIDPRWKKLQDFAQLKDD